MFFIKRAWYYVTRKLGKIITIGFILLIVSTLVLTGLMIKSASASAANVARNKLGASVTYTSDLSSIMEGNNPGERPSERGRGFTFELPIDYRSITTKEIELIAENSKYVKNYVITASLAGEAVDFIYYNPFGNSTAETNENFDQPMRRTQANVNIIGLDVSSKNELFDVNTLVAGRYFLDDEITDAANVIIIEQTIANLNNIGIGDTITISKQDMKMMQPDRTETEQGSIDITYEVIGIYKTNNPTDLKSGGFMNSGSLSENTMYLPYTTILQADLASLADEELVTKLNDIKENGYEVNSVKFNLKNPTDIDDFIEEVENLAIVDITYRSLNANDTAYQKMVGPIENVANTSTILVIVVIVAGAFIIGLLSILSIKDRKYELGVLLSLGEPKFKIVLQLITEMLVVAVFSFSLAILASNYIAQSTTNYLLNQEINSNQTTGLNPNFENNLNNRGGRNIFMRPDTQNLNIIDVEKIDELTINLNIKDVINMLGIGIFIIIVGNTIQALFVLRANPKEILLER